MWERGLPWTQCGHFLLVIDTADTGDIDLDLVETSIWQQMLERRDDPLHRNDYVEYRVKKKDGSILSVVDIGRLISTENYGEVFFVFIRTKGELAINV